MALIKDEGQASLQRLDHTRLRKQIGTSDGGKSCRGGGEAPCLSVRSVDLPAERMPARRVQHRRSIV